MKFGKVVYRNYLLLFWRFFYFKYEIYDEGEICVKVGKRFFILIIRLLYNRIYK